MSRAYEQAAVVLVAMALWSIQPIPSFLALLGAYAIAWLVLNVARALNARWFRISLSRTQAIAIAALLAVPSIAQAARLFDRFVADEGLDEVDHAVASRMRLEATPSIAPPLVAADRPQTFYVHAPGASRVYVRFGPRAAPLVGRALGEGLFRVVYDPQRHGPPDPRDGALTARIEVDGTTHERAMLAVAPLAHPRWLMASPDRTSAATVSEETDELIVIDTHGLRHRIVVGDGPSDVRYVGGALAVAHRYSEVLLFVDPASGRTRSRRPIGALSHRMAALNEVVAIGQHGERSRIVVSRERGPIERIDTAFVPDWIAFGATAERLVVSSIQPPALHRFARIGGAWREDRRPLWLGRPAVTLARSPDGARVIVAATDYRPDGPPHLGNHFVQDRLITIDVEAWSIVEHRLTPLRTSRQESPGNVDRGVSPMGIDIAEDGSVLVAFAGTDDVWRIAPGTPEPELFGLEDHPLAAPCSVVALGDGFAVSSPSYGTIGLFDRNGRRRALTRLAPGDRILLRENQRALQRRIGERVFYESTRAGISCQSCHLHAASDGSAHNIGGRTLVSTLDTRGIYGTPPYLRDGGYPTIGSLDTLARTIYRGYERPQGGRRISLERFVESLPRPIPYRQLSGRDEGRERRGVRAFVRARCVVCHAFPAFTNLGQHPVEAVFPDLAGEQPGYELDTPSLLGLGQSAPYLVDGRARTLEEIFVRYDRGRRHGDWRRLTRRERDDLFYFLAGL